MTLRQSVLSILGFLAFVGAVFYFTVLGVTQNYPVADSLWIGTRVMQLDGTSGIPLWERVAARSSPDAGDVECFEIYAPQGVRSQYAVLAFGTEQTLTNFVLSGAPRAAVFRGYRPVGDYVHEAAGAARFVWREFHLEVGRRADREAARFANRIDRNGYKDVLPD